MKAFIRPDMWFDAAESTMVGQGFLDGIVLADFFDSWDAFAVERSFSRRRVFTVFCRFPPEKISSLPPRVHGGSVLIDLY